MDTSVSPLVAANMTLDSYPLAMDVPVMQRIPDAMFQFGVLEQHYNITEHDPARARRDRRLVSQFATRILAAYRAIWTFTIKDKAN